MGFKKGRAARAAAERAAAANSKPLNVRHDCGTAVTYDAPNGSTYEIDVELMIQRNPTKGTSRNVHRHRGHVKHWTMWQYEAERAEGRNYTHSKTTLIQYPKEVCLALEDRYQAIRKLQAKAAEFGAPVVDRQRATDAWRVRLERMSPELLRQVFQQNEAFEQAPTTDLEEDFDAPGLARRAALDTALCEALLEAALRRRDWSPAEVTQAMRWLMNRGLQPGPAHVCKAALLYGALMPLQVLLLDACIDVRGLELPLDQRDQRQKDVGNGGGWVQRCKPALKALLARGAVLSSHSLQSRLLKRLEEDGTARWTERVLEGMQRERPDLPDMVLTRIAEFAGSASSDRGITCPCAEN
ncbi:unnamed protein product [Symbiodinium pilosum]|uniref:Uncharacterized protein n=1 Tax=Symbiodinium pilosum TaxID=2952 RepID=A0A812R3U9_SYMPI|nr:unnamed protein product [Symbiodinium pilosum]